MASFSKGISMRLYIPLSGMQISTLNLKLNFYKRHKMSHTKSLLLLKHNM